MRKIAFDDIESIDHGSPDPGGKAVQLRNRYNGVTGFLLFLIDYISLYRDCSSFRTYRAKHAWLGKSLGILKVDTAKFMASHNLKLKAGRLEGINLRGRACGCDK